MAKITKIKLKNDIKEIPEIYDQVVKFCVEQNLPKYLWHDISLILDEAVTNAIKHGFTDGKDGRIQIDMINSEEGTSVRVIDRGLKFNPLGLPDPDTKSSIEKRRVGGLGVYLMKKLADRVNYSYKYGANVLTIKFDVKG
ncbi:MAG: ATP-binding protein [Holosporales bacterium]|jgi:anti-sigma regulatory factor (Ser/Thr protein kinase)|nr:ATP-binding protein [Holosporales bacterium]